MNKKTISTAGAFAVWVMGSGFATGQEILQFLTSYGYKSFILVAITLIGFLLVGAGILEAGQENRDLAGFSHFEYFCGKKAGVFYTWFLPVSMFAAMIILISGAGSTLEEYYGINHYIGALMMALMAFAAYVIGFQRFVKAASYIGTIMIAFTVFVGLVTVIRDFDTLRCVNEYSDLLAKKQPVSGWWLSGLLYISYNMCGGSKYYTALGAESESKRQARMGAIVGAIALVVAILLMNTAMLTDIEKTAVLDIPTLYLAKKISPVLGAGFSIILILGIFSSCSAMLWTVCDKFVAQGSKKSYIVAACVSIAAFLIGLLPFAQLVGKVYSVLGYIGLIFITCVIIKKIRVKRKNRTLRSGTEL